MKREVLESDLRRLYNANDCVKANCGGCVGCSECCQGMGESIVLDPLDVWRLSEELKEGFSAMMEHCLELHMVDGLILPNLKMAGEEERCVFLNKEGRCGIHPARPGICRLFPLGRIYENGSFQYFLQNMECPKENKTKIKVSKWLDTPNLKQYEEYVNQWHYFLEEIRQMLEEQQDEELVRDLNTYLLNTFYVERYPSDVDFYEEFSRRYEKMGKLINILKKK